ncbi:hypothetical protein Ga0100231_020300 [Opitutaceae bacterium TAV4]|nr:hypothetical protein Ga0100231_020300 [Opitutaceae bacterium TAV4]RRK01214.1 hypothetical protein Ga0100230_021105 [Opitutaceae bacterium TAV3]
MLKTSAILLLLLALILLAGGCNTATRDALEIGPFYAPANTRGASLWPDDIRRVAVLPLDGTAAALPDDFIASHDPIWLAALQHTQRAEFVPVSRDQIAYLAQGRRSVDSTSVLPAVFFEKILSITGADAVIFCDLTGVTPYPPLAIGLRAKLIHLRRGNLIWACDERFDASVATVGNSARRFARKTGDGSGRGDPVTAILQSPARFATYATAEVAATLPPRRNETPDSKL